jgi:hypothetical protein
MTAWWVIGDEARSEFFRIDPEEAIQNTKIWHRVIATRWGNVAGITEACHIYPRRPSTWHREDPKVRENLDVLAADRVHCANRLAERRMLEGDPASLRAKIQAARPPKLTKKEQRHQDWLNRKIYTDDELKVKLEELGYPDGWDRKPDFVMPDNPNAVLRHLAGNYSNDPAHPSNAGTRRP